MNQSLSWKKIIPIGLMLFSSFFGAGNLIFPPLIGYLSGTNLNPAFLGFCITGVGLPLLGVLTIALKGTDNVNDLAKPVSEKFAKFIMFLTALTIGPLFAIPRTAAVSYELGIAPMIQNPGQLHLAIYSAIYFLITIYVALNPSKVVKWLGKILTPIMLICLAILFFCVFNSPTPEFVTPTGTYATAPFFSGFTEGYNTMDMLAAFLFGTATISAIKMYGITDKKELTRACFWAGLIAAFFLGVIYYCLAFTGAESIKFLEGNFSNGTGILVSSAKHYLGNSAHILLGLIIVLPSITTSIGLVASIGDYLNQMFPKTANYRAFAIAIVLFSFAVSNVGLDNIISYAVPVLCFLYPIMIVLALLNILGSIFNDNKLVYRFSIFPVILSTFVDVGRTFGLNVPGQDFLTAYVPLYSNGFGWLSLGVIGAIVGYIVSRFVDVE